MPGLILGDYSRGPAAAPGQVPAAAPGPKKLVLCFDGTGNAFTGSNADTNVVKLLAKLDRNAPGQYHYYQTGIGTYDITETFVNRSWLGEMQGVIYQTIDQAMGTTFDSRVLAAYRSLMRYYDQGDHIYMFGFSRGAFQAKFLARMINTVGLLCKGNEEMAPFAYRLYQRYLAGQHQDSRLHVHKFDVARDEITAFADTFCRREVVTLDDGTTEEVNIKVHFLGIWDCVNSVSILERKAPTPVPVVGTARHVRHAVSVDERRVKFRAALMAQDVGYAHEHHHHEDIQEVWFPGCHADVGGGWGASEDEESDEDGNMISNKKAHRSVWQWCKDTWDDWFKPKDPNKTKPCSRLQLSDVSLAWMMAEVDKVGELNPSAALKWRDRVDHYREYYNEHKEEAMRGLIHDPLSFNKGTGWFQVIIWRIMEYLPFITRWELEDGKWQHRLVAPNAGRTRDIPESAVLHESLLWRLRNDERYLPRNNHGDDSGKDLPACLKHPVGGSVHIARCHPDHDHHEVCKDSVHRTFTVLQPAYKVAASIAQVGEVGAAVGAAGGMKLHGD